MLAVWHGTPKDRKAIIKSFKTFVPKICDEEHGHLVLMAVFDAVDDTKLVSKAVISEIADKMEDIAKTVTGRKVLMYLMAPRNTKYFHPDVISNLKVGDGNEHSKKDADIRWEELRTATAAPLVKHVALAITTWDIVEDKKAALFFTCVLNALPGALARPALEALAEVAAKPFEDNINVVENAATHTMLKKLIAHDKVEGGRASPDRFSEIVLDAMDDDSTECWVRTNRGAFLLADMFDVDADKLGDKIKEKLAGLKKTLKMQKCKGAEILRGKLGGDF
jgi:pumilio family protein 6